MPRLSSSLVVSSSVSQAAARLRAWAGRRVVLDGGGVALLMAVYGLVWVLLYALTTLSPPVDNVEQLVWLRSMEWGYFKHPPLPTWILGAVATVFDATPGLTYLLGALATLASLALYWHLLRGLRGARYATLGLLAAMGITLYCGRIYYYNHNVLLMLWVALTAWLSWRLAVRPSLGTWALLGLVAGLGMLTKYQFVLALAVVGLWWLRLQGWRQAAHRNGALLAALVAALVFAPHLYWLVSHEWMPLAYAKSSALGHDLRGTQRLLHGLQFALDWLLNRSLPACLAGAGWLLVVGAAPACSSCRAGGGGHAGSAGTSVPAALGRCAAGSHAADGVAGRLQAAPALGHGLHVVDGSRGHGVRGCASTVVGIAHGACRVAGFRPGTGPGDGPGVDGLTQGGAWLQSRPYGFLPVRARGGQH